MSEESNDQSIVYAVYKPTGQLRHVTEVENGKACNCVCPNPRCGQPLNARNMGEKRAPHFAHLSGSCSWASEYLIAMLAEQIIKLQEWVALPKLTYHDAEKACKVVHARAGAINVESVELREISGRGAPEAIVSWLSRDKNERRKYALVVPFIHPLTDGQVARIAEQVDGVVVIDFHEELKRVRREQGRHYDRTQVAAHFQSRDYIQNVLLDLDSNLKSWAYSAKRDSLEEESRKRWQVVWEKRQAEERERQEQLKKEREAAAKRAAELARQREEERRLKAAEAMRREMEMLPENAYMLRPEMEAAIDSHTGLAKDEFGRRWVKCAICGKVALEDEFMTYGGRMGMNFGKCKACAGM